jgi:pimeloyl-ACP methyl ester carboxylesterase
MIAVRISGMVAVYTRAFMWVGDERLVRVNGVELAYQELGDPDGEPMLLVMGLGMQLIHWQLGFCELLADEGFRVIRFDNRDAGHSTRFGSRPPDRVAMMLGRRRGLAYTLDDMADDTAGLIEALGHESAHVAGVSQGGMIAPVLAYRHPARVRSLGLIMTGSGKRVASVPRLRALGTLLMRSPRDRDGFADFVVRTFRVIGSPGYQVDEDELRRLALESFDRGIHPAGIARQLHAITASGDRSKLLRKVRAPTVVIHGARDPLIRPAAGRSVARAIPGAELRMIHGMGHDLPRQLWPEIAGALVANARRTRVGAAAAV